MIPPALVSTAIAFESNKYPPPIVGHNFFSLSDIPTRNVGLITRPGIGFAGMIHESLRRPLQDICIFTHLINIVLQASWKFCNLCPGQDLGMPFQHYVALLKITSGKNPSLIDLRSLHHNIPRHCVSNLVMLLITPFTLYRFCSRRMKSIVPKTRNTKKRTPMTVISTSGLNATARAMAPLGVAP